MGLDSRGPTGGPLQGGSTREAHQIMIMTFNKTPRHKATRLKCTGPTAGVTAHGIEPLPLHPFCIMTRFAAHEAAKNMFLVEPGVFGELGPLAIR